MKLREILILQKEYFITYFEDRLEIITEQVKVISIKIVTAFDEKGKEK